MEGDGGLIAEEEDSFLSTVLFTELLHPLFDSLFTERFTPFVDAGEEGPFSWTIRFSGELMSSSAFVVTGDTDAGIGEAAPLFGDGEQTGAEDTDVMFNALISDTIEKSYCRVTIEETVINFVSEVETRGKRQCYLNRLQTQSE